MSSNDKADDDSLVEGSNYSGELLKEVLTNWRDAESQFRKTITLIIIIAVVFELLTRGGGAELTFSFIRVTDLRLVDIYIPVVVAYLTYNLHSLFSDLDYYENRVSSMLRVLSKEADAPYLATPPNSILSSTLHISLQRESRAASILLGLGILKWVAVMGGPLAFEAYAFVRLAEKYGVASWAYWLSVVLSLALCVMAVLILIFTLGGRGQAAGAVRAFIKAFSQSYRAKDDAVIH